MFDIILEGGAAFDDQKTMRQTELVVDLYGTTDQDWITFTRLLASCLRLALRSRI